MKILEVSPPRSMRSWKNLPYPPASLLAETAAAAKRSKPGATGDGPTTWDGFGAKKRKGGSKWLVNRDPYFMVYYNPVISG